MPQTPLEKRSLDAVPNSPDRQQPVGFILRLAKALHTYGVPAYELETVLSACAAKLGFGLQCLSLPTSITITLMLKEEAAQTFVIRIAPGDIHLKKLRMASEIASQVMKGEITTIEGADALKRLAKANRSYPDWLFVISFVLISAAMARIFGGGWNEIIGASAAGLILGILTLLATRFSLLTYLLPAVGALLTTLVAHSTAYFLPGTEPYISVVSGLIILLPGLTLTIAMAELATQNLMSGTARIFGAGTVFILIAFGAVLGNHLASVVLPENMAPVQIVQLPQWTEWAAVFLGSLVLVIIFQARLRDWLWVMLGGVLAFAVVKFATLIFSNAMAAFIGAICVGAAANLVSRYSDVPGATIVVPGFIMLVPGSLGFKSLTALLEHDIIGGLGSAFNMILVGISLVSGLLISSLVALPKAKGIDDLDIQ